MIYLIYNSILLLDGSCIPKVMICYNCARVQGPVRFKENSRLGNVLINQIIGEEETCVGEYSGVTRSVGQLVSTLTFILFLLI